MNWKTPFFGTALEFAAHRDAIMSRVEAVYASGQVLMGSDVQQLEQQVGTACDRRHAIAVGSCTDALYFALAAAGIGPGDEVLVPDFTFVASASCILRAGAKPVFVDIAQDANMDLSKAEAAITIKTRAMIYVHLYGLMGDADAVENFAAKHGLILIEDAAQAIGARRANRKAGSMGLISCLSFDPTKPIGAPGSGGMAMTDDADLAATLRRLRYHGRNERREFVSLGYNSQMPSATAAVLRYKMRFAEAWEDRRRAVAALYKQGLADSDCLLPPEPSDARHIYHKFVIRHPRRKELQEALASHGVQAMVHYPSPLHCHALFADCVKSVESPLADAFAGSVLSLPCHPFLADAEVENITTIILETLKS